jgi:nicotinate-nucleotide adenylyltransferase
MCELAAEPLPRFAVSDCEIRRTEPSYTILTIEHFAKTVGPHATIFLLIGEDNLPLLHTWHRIADLPQLARLAILPRSPRHGVAEGEAGPPPQSVIPSAAEGSRREAGPPAADHPPQSVIPSAAEGSRRDALPPALSERSESNGSFPVSEFRIPNSEFIRIPSPLVPISGTDIRQRVRTGQSIAGLVPASVADYIARHGLYHA